MTNSADPDQKPTDLDLHCLQMQGISGLSMHRVNRGSKIICPISLQKWSGSAHKNYLNIVITEDKPPAFNHNAEFSYLLIKIFFFLEKYNKY